jgi:tetratricopeptide (TPR) repeat protein
MASISKITGQAMAAIEAGNPNEAATLYQQIMQRDESHREALFFLANYCFQSNQLPQATAFLRRYITLEPSHSAPRRLLGEIAEQQNDFASAFTLYQQAVDAAPEMGVAYLYLAALHARQGRNNTAAQLASRAFELDNNLLFVVQDETTHPGARDRAARMERVMCEVMTRHHRSTAKTDRIKALRWCATDDSSKDDHTADHRPFLMDLPGVGKSPYLPSPVADAMQAAAVTILAEINGALDVQSDGIAQAPLHIGADIMHDDWRALHFWRGGIAQADTLARFPKTAEILRGLPLSTVAGVPAYAWISVLQPGAEMPVHHGASSAHITVHLGINVPEGNSVLQVMGEERSWQNGEAFAFMDSFSHNSWNYTDSPRVVLVVQAPHPDLTAAEAADLQHCLDARAAWLAQRIPR